MAVRLLEELTDLERLSLVDVSYSRLSTLAASKDNFACDAKYFYTYIAQYPRQFGAAAALGNVVHKALENKLEPDTALDLDILLQEYEEQLPQWDPDNLIDHSLRSAGREMLTEFVDRHMGETFPIAAKEFHFKVVVGRGLITGFIDRVDIQGDTVIITDYKSGKNEVAAKNIPTNLQLGIYALVMRKYYPDHKIFAQMYYLKSGQQKGHLFNGDDLNAVESNLLMLINDLVDKRDYKPTSNERICKWCDFNNGVCPIGTIRASKY